MRNRAKCKLCKDIIESFHRHDYVHCSCGEISIDGGQNCFNFKASARDFSNFLRVDDEGNEIEVKFVEKEQDIPKDTSPVDRIIDGVSKIMHDWEDTCIKELMEPASPTKEELLKMFDDFIKTYEDLPEQAMRLPINHYDHLSLMYLIRSILKVESR